MAGRTTHLATRRLAFAILAMAAIYAAGLPMASAADEDPLQDFCVGIPAGSPTINGFPCKAAKDTVSSDFKSAALAGPGNTNNANKAAVTPAFAAQFPGLNTLGISAARIDFAAGGLNPPHVHPRATELLFLVEGTLEVGFVSSNANVLYQETLNAGDLFVFPRGLLHFQKNTGYGKAWAIAALSSQNPGVQQAAKALFAASPQPISTDVLAQTFGIDAKSVLVLEKAQK